MADLLIFGLLVGAVYLVLKSSFLLKERNQKKSLVEELKPTLNRMSESASSLYSNHSASNATSSNRTQSTVKSQSNVETLKDDEFLEVVIPTTGVEVIDLKRIESQNS
ncbi:hypothetical protein KVP08_023065 (plasmid) [Shewanella putrefaciens]|nr:hypothetical protein KVP08_023065 [Shewanella putrefaciens]